MGGNRDIVTLDREPVVWENDTYRIVVGISELKQPAYVVANSDQTVLDKAPIVYKIVNKEWEVVEDEQNRLPQAMFSVGLLALQMEKEGWEQALELERTKTSPLALPNPAKVVSQQ